MFARLLTAAVVAAVASAAPATAAVITQFNFNSPTPDGNTGTGTTTPNIGAGTIAVVGGVTSPGFNSGVGSSDPAAADDSAYQTSTYPTQGMANKTAGVEVAVSTVGMRNIMVTFDQRHSNTSSRFAQFQYSTDGTTFTDFGDLFVGDTGDTWFNGRTVDLTGVAGVANNANFEFRIVAAFAPGTSEYTASRSTSAYGPTGTWRFDMVTVSGDLIPAAPVPAPAGLVLFSIGGVTVLGRRLVRRAAA